MNTQSNSNGKRLAVILALSLFSLTFLLNVTIAAQVRPIAAGKVRLIELNRKPDLRIVEMEYNIEQCKIGVLVANESLGSVENATVLVEYSTKDAASVLLVGASENLAPNESKWVWGSVISQNMLTQKLTGKSCHAELILSVRAAVDPRWLRKRDGVLFSGEPRYAARIIDSQATLESLGANSTTDKINEPAINESNENNNELTVTMAAMRKTGGPAIRKKP